MRDFNRGGRSGSGRDFGRRDFGRSGGFGRPSFGGDRGPRRMFPAVCSNCGNNCEVPFEPNGSKPVYCNDCFAKMGGGRNNDSRGGFQDRGARRPFFEKRSDSRPQNNEQFEQINRKLDKIMAMLGSGPISTQVPVKKEKVFTKEKVMNSTPVEKTLIVKKKVKIFKKKTPVVG